jgi:Sin3 binding region of histone deacetylase complex subunit SAP30
MGLKDLHNYRHAYHLNTSSSQTNPQAHLIFANAARKGIYSPSVVAARRKQRELVKSRKEAAAGLKERSSSRLKGAANGAGNTSSIDVDESGKQTKERLAMAVRKHFNAMSVSESEVVARFTYVVRHMAGSSDGDQDKGFRMRFKPYVPLYL